MGVRIRNQIILLLKSYNESKVYWYVDVILNRICAKVSPIDVDESTVNY